MKCVKMFSINAESLTSFFKMFLSHLGFSKRLHRRKRTNHSNLARPSVRSLICGDSGTSLYTRRLKNRSAISLNFLRWIPQPTTHPLLFLSLFFSLSTSRIHASSTDEQTWPNKSHDREIYYRESGFLLCRHWTYHTHTCQSAYTYRTSFQTQGRNPVFPLGFFQNSHLLKNNKLEFFFKDVSI